MSFPASSGITFPMAWAAPVVVGTMLIAAALDLLNLFPLSGASRIFWFHVYAWIVVMNPVLSSLYPARAFAIGARQFVVQDAPETILSSEVRVSWFTP